MRGPKHVESRKQEEAQYFKEMKVTGFRNQQDLHNFPIHRCYSSLHWKWCLRTWLNAQNSEAKLWSTDLHWKTVILCQSNVSKQILSDHKTATLNWLELKPTVFLVVPIQFITVHERNICYYFMIDSLKQMECWLYYWLHVFLPLLILAYQTVSVSCWGACLGTNCALSQQKGVEC